MNAWRGSGTAAGTAASPSRGSGNTRSAPRASRTRSTRSDPRMFYPLGDGFLVIEGSSSFLAVARALRRLPLCIETAEGEIVQGLEPDDLVAASAPNGGPL